MEVVHGGVEQEESREIWVMLTQEQLKTRKPIQSLDY